MSNALSQFLLLQNMDITSFSAKLGVPYTTAWRIVRGKVTPSDPLKLKIYQITKGQITPNDFYDLPALFEGDQPDLFGAVSSPKIFPESRITPSGLDCQESCQPMGAGC